ncbi:MAG: beta-eliminating lyase-related protein [Panacibacter sp.]
MKNVNRRKFIQLSGLSAIPLVAPFFTKAQTQIAAATAGSKIFFNTDGPVYTPAEYTTLLQEINNASPIERDSYFEGGVVQKLEERFAAITQKEAAIYMPTGTLANQLAISVLSGQNSKVFVQETSHVFRDEADAAQSVYQKRLIPLAKGLSHFTAAELEEAVNYHQQGEVFKTGFGAISIENPVRRCDEQAVPFEEIKKIAAYCKKNNFKLHLDGARLYLASAYTGVSVTEYAAYFDTVYISLYKYLGAGGGAILCGPKNIIEKMKHLVKVHGGAMYTGWANAAMALHHLTGLPERLFAAKIKFDELMPLLNEIPGVKIAKITNGTNIHNLTLNPSINVQKLNQFLRDKQNIFLGGKREDGFIKVAVNETILKRSNAEIVAAYTDAVSYAKA